MCFSFIFEGIIIGGTLYGDEGDFDPELRSAPEFKEVQLSCKLCLFYSFLG